MVFRLLVQRKGSAWSFGHVRRPYGCNGHRRASAGDRSAPAKEPQMKPLMTHHAQHPNYPDERGSGVPHPDKLSPETRASMDRAWRRSEAAEERARTAADAAYAQYLKTKGGT